MKKIINFSFIVCIVCIILIIFYKQPKDMVILVKRGTKINEVLEEYMNDNNLSISVEYYNTEDELISLLKNGKYDLLISRLEVEDKLLKNDLIKEIDKDKIPNYRNIEKEYMNDNKMNVPLYINNNDLYVMYITNNNKSIDLIDYLLRANVSADLIKNNNYNNINWASAYYL